MTPVSCLKSSREMVLAAAGPLERWCVFRSQANLIQASPIERRHAEMSIVDAFRRFRRLCAEPDITDARSPLLKPENRCPFDRFAASRSLSPFSPTVGVRATPVREAASGEASHHDSPSAPRLLGLCRPRIFRPRMLWISRANALRT